jgi:hypothetical protein
MTGAVVSVVTERVVVVVVGAEPPHAVRAPTESNSAKQPARPAMRPTEYFAVTILKPSVIVYFVQSNIPFAELFHIRRSGEACAKELQ